MRFSTHSLLPLLLSICQRISTAYTQHTIVQWWLSNKTAHLLYCSLQKMDYLSFVTTITFSSSLSLPVTLLRQVNRKKRKKSLLNSRRDRRQERETGLALSQAFQGLLIPEEAFTGHTTRCLGRRRADFARCPSPPSWA